MRRFMQNDRPQLIPHRNVAGRQGVLLVSPIGMYQLCKGLFIVNLVLLFVDDAEYIRRRRKHMFFTERKIETCVSGFARRAD